MMEIEREKYSNFLFKECLVMKQSVEGGNIEKVREDQGRIDIESQGLCFVK